MIPFLVAALGSAVALPWLRRALSGPGWIDQPRADRHHARPVSRAGGPAWFVGLTSGFAALLFMRHTLVDWVVISLLLAAALAAFVVGRLDESGLFRPSIKWRLQVALLLLTVLGLMLAQGEGGDPSHVPRLRLALALLAGVGLQLALNIADNLDGALGSTGLAGLLGLGLVGAPFEPVRGAALAGAGATLGFLLWNAPPARAFLGNGGSEMVALLASAFLTCAWADAEATPHWTLLAPFAWPLFDLLFVVLRRWREGRRPWEGGRDHSTHALSRRLGSDRPVFLLLLLVAGLGLLAALRLGAR